MQIKTATTVAGVNCIDFGNTPDKYYWVKNVGDTTVHVSGTESCTPDADGVAILVAGDVILIEDYDGMIFVHGEGKVQIYETDTMMPPVEPTPIVGSSGSSPDEHLTDEEFKEILNIR